MLPPASARCSFHTENRINRALNCSSRRTEMEDGQAMHSTKWASDKMNKRGKAFVGRTVFKVSFRCSEMQSSQQQFIISMLTKFITNTCIKQARKVNFKHNAIYLWDKITIVSLDSSLGWPFQDNSRFKADEKWRMDFKIGWKWSKKERMTERERKILHVVRSISLNVFSSLRLQNSKRGRIAFVLA